MPFNLQQTSIHDYIAQQLHAQALKYFQQPKSSFDPNLNTLYMVNMVVTCERLKEQHRFNQIQIPYVWGLKRCLQKRFKQYEIFILDTDLKSYRTFAYKTSQAMATLYAQIQNQWRNQNRWEICYRSILLNNASHISFHDELIINWLYLMQKFELQMEYVYLNHQPFPFQEFVKPYETMRIEQLKGSLSGLYRVYIEFLRPELQQHHHLKPVLDHANHNFRQWLDYLTTQIQPNQRSNYKRWELRMCNDLAQIQKQLLHQGESIVKRPGYLKSRYDAFKAHFQKDPYTLEFKLQFDMMNLTLNQILQL